MALTLLPLLLAAGLGYFVLHRSVVGDFADVTQLQKQLLQPVKDLQLSMLQAEEPLDEYLEFGGEDRMDSYRALRRRVEATYPRLLPLLDGELAGLVERSRDDWGSLDLLVTDMVAAQRAGNTAALVEAQTRFDGVQAAAQDKLQAAGDLLERRVETDYRDAILGLERSEWIAGIAGGISLLVMALGIGLFYRTIINSVERLIEGAERFSEGDRDHRIEVQIPRELHLVAEELNKMIGTIRESEHRLVEMAQRDTLTGLLNRQTWDANVSDAQQRMNRHGEKFCVVVADLDHFKKVNDSHGHDAGDAVLRIVAGILSASLRTIDKVHRMGGEEFAMLLPATDMERAVTTAERIRKAVEARQIHFPADSIHVTISMGVAEATVDTTGADLYKQADTALYQAKTGGRNAVVVFRG